MADSAENYRALMIVAHPDDETIWAGGTILMHPDWHWSILTLCRGDDPDRSPKFRRALEVFGASGTMGTLDDSPGQEPLDIWSIKNTVLSMANLTDNNCFDVLICHSPFGEYTRHRRHEELSLVLCDLWVSGELPAREIWFFAYDDAGGIHTPAPISDASDTITLPDDIYRRKQDVISHIYGFGPENFEAKAAGPVEAFWKFNNTRQLHQWLLGRIDVHENSSAL